MAKQIFAVARKIEVSGRIRTGQYRPYDGIQTTHGYAPLIGELLVDIELAFESVNQWKLPFNIGSAISDVNTDATVSTSFDSFGGIVVDEINLLVAMLCILASLFVLRRRRRG